MSSLLQIGGIAFIAVVWLRATRGPSVVLVAQWLYVATVAITIVTNKTFSAQYVVWLGGPLAAMLALAPDSRPLRRVVWLALGIAVLTQLEYPIFYDALAAKDLRFLTVGTAALAVRNILMVWLVAVTVRATWQHTSGSRSAVWTPERTTR